MGLFYSEIESCALHILNKNTITQLDLQSARYFWERSLCSITKTILQYLNHYENRLCWTPFHWGFLYFLCKGAVFWEAVSPNLKLPILSASQVLESWACATMPGSSNLHCYQRLDVLFETSNSTCRSTSFFMSTLWLQLPPACSPNVSTQNSHLLTKG